MSDEKVLDLKAAAVLLGMRGRRPGRRLLRKLREVERRTGRKILTVAGAGKLTRYSVTVGALMQHFPGAWVTSGEILRPVAADMGRLRAKIAELIGRIEELEASMAHAWAAISRARTSPNVATRHP